jgi:hypothetical protein
MLPWGRSWPQTDIVENEPHRQDHLARRVTRRLDGLPPLRLIFSKTQSNRLLFSSSHRMPAPYELEGDHETYSGGFHFVGDTGDRWNFCLGASDAVRGSASG